MKCSTFSICAGLFLALQMNAQNVPYYTPVGSTATESAIPQPTIPDSALSGAMKRQTDAVLELDKKLQDAMAEKKKKEEELRELKKVLSDAKNKTKEDEERQDALEKEVDVRKAREDSLTKAIAKNAIEYAAQNRKREEEMAREEKMKDELAAAEALAKNGPKEFLEASKEQRLKTKKYYNELFLVKTTGIKDAKVIDHLRDSIHTLMVDSLQNVIDEKGARIAAYNTLNSSVGVLLVNGKPETTEEFYDPFNQEGSKFLQSNILTLSTESGNGALYSEIFNDYIGPVRIGFGGLLSSSLKSVEEDSTASDATSIAEDQAQRVLGGGGNTVATFGVPLIGYTGASGTFMFRFSFQPKLALDLTKYNDDAANTPFHSDLGFELHTSLSGRDGIISFFGSVRPSILVGNPSFYDNLQKGDMRSIAMAQVRFGMGISNILRVSYSVNAGDAFVQKTFPSQLTVTLLTDGLKGK